VPRFRDVVSADRQQMRESRAKRRARKAKEVQEGEYVPLPEDDKLGLELDVLADASGLGSVKKQVTPLEQVSGARWVLEQRERQLLELTSFVSFCKVYEHTTNAARS
jgi:hypothetical protein